MLGDDEQRDQPDDQRGGAEPVDAVVAPLLVNVQGAVDDHQRDEPDGDVDVEDPAPSGDAEDALLTGEETANDRTQHARGGEDGHEVALVARALAGRDQVAEDGQRQGEQAARTDAPERPGTRRACTCSGTEPHNAEPVMKIVMAIMNNGLRP